MYTLNITNSFLNDAYIDYCDKVLEVRHFFDFIDILENSKELEIKGNKKISNEPISPFRIERNLIETIQSSGFLLLYNLIESTMTASIDAIYQTLQQLEVKYSSNNTELFIFTLSENLRKELLKQYSSIFSSEGIKEISSQKIHIFGTIINKGYNKKNLFNGNIDCAEINNIAMNRFGFKVRPLEGMPFNPQHILTIKTKRNELAHGAFTFNEVSRTLAIGELKKHFDSTIKLLDGVFSSIDCYLQNQKYLENP
ncbi:MAE_28990/MAE_18760 family HEPN-like nuclease [Acinetobacter baumannii]|nr:MULTISPECIES: MAE_28990/MAE_18760 family HEPN-like nuclease [Acinetobacter calcoaceticus/baumannii complex]MCZ3201092.1 MAE_28990/MAE_18760 family HEPN-like nuclease [Acinetobacter baumannii]MDC4334315.1 MAE_28990/MAE_18760 family HEPN-like nuclease [Acinetobacter baumannii]MDC4943243.1 MAE_28990/MAE_18760 family HEPN-like nuclease [Acinetobacter baumannii]MDC5298042.1 MAE_28990/MAE_18760 family HEPN-like nuclease [Acinetobacter baumannii]MDC5462441.1 MAE_28990/MAE_18760 family HEPN-like nu